MANKLLVRLYNVGLGDCIYVRIPAELPATEDFHILIDCGSWSGADNVKKAVKHLENNMLPAVAGSGGKKGWTCWWPPIRTSTISWVSNRRCSPTFKSARSG